MVFSLNPLDQARVLAVEFQRLVNANVPITFIAFPPVGAMRANGRGTVP
jgi:hypothetical protein